jgi:preprotein translocase SecE subunit
MTPMATTQKPPAEKSNKKPRQSDASTSPIESMTEYFKGVRSEWGKISWPTWPQIWGQTIVVLVMVSIMTLGLFIMDYSFHWIITLITPHSS